ncbi:TonB-dependent receptor [Niveispirillum fermenti]|uniref:TonB-dependent receptor n=1 Tax=Niveispirillum fermenti TaxID=1233113 RepID=UPI003A86D196
MIVFNPVAMAQGSAAAAGNPGMLEEIVVIARQRNETARETPVAVSAFTADTIEKAGITGPADFLSLTPNVSFLQTTNVGETQVHIRGVIQPRDTEPPFAYVLDGVLVPNPSAFNQEMVDIEQIEVIKGPLGSIYGRNAVGGAILVSTKKPGDTPEGEVRAGYEFAGNEYKLSGYVGGPLVEDRLYGRITAVYKDREGYYDNVTLNKKEDGFSEGQLRGRFVYKATENIEVDLSVGYAEIDGYAFNFNNQTAGTPGFENGVDITDTSIPYSGNVESFNNQKRFDFASKIDWTSEAGTLSFTAAYHDLKENMGGEGAVDLALFGVPFPGAPAPGDFFTDPSLYEGYGPTLRDGTQYQERNQDDTSFELRFTSPGENRLRYIAGAYYIEFNREVVLNRGDDLGQGVVVANPLGGPENPLVAVTWTDNANKAWALFGQLAYDITPDLEISTALRYDKENRSSENLTPAAYSPIPNVEGLVRKENFSDLQPRVSLRWNASEEVSVYATYGEGFRSGGFNPLGSRFNIINVDGVTNTTVQDAFDKETSVSYEAGVKTRLLDGRLTLNLAAFTTKVENAHFFQFFPFSLSRVISIVDRNDIKGFEVDGVARVAEGLDLFFGYGYLDSEIKANAELPQTVGNRFPFTAKYDLMLGGQYTTPVTGDYDMLARVEYNRTGPMFYDTLNTPGTERPAINLVNARLGIENERWGATLFARNLFDKRYNVDGVVLVVPNTTVFNFTTKAAPRTWGLELKARF